MKYGIALESRIASWAIFGDKVFVPKHAKIIFNKLYPKELEKLRNKVCPWCGKTFSSRRTLKLHLKSFRRNRSCNFAFNSMVKDVTNIYMELLWRKNKDKALAELLVTK